MSARHRIRSCRHEPVRRRAIRYGDQQRRGSAYILVLSVSMIVAVVGISGLMVSRINQRSASASSDMTAARAHALAAVEMGLFAIEADPLNWRESFDSDNLPTDMPIAGGTLTLLATDPVDGNLTNNAADPVLFTAIGVDGAARHKLQVTITFTGGVTNFQPGSWKQVVD